MEIELPKPLETDRAADEHKLFCGEVVAEGSPPQLRAASAIAAPSSASPRTPHSGSILIKFALFCPVVNNPA